MNLTKRLSIGIAMLCCSSLCAADFRPLDVKTGQWETTMTGQMTGLPAIPPEALAHMTPEQRARMESAMGARGAKPIVSKSCMTKDKLDKAFNVDNDALKSCSRTLVTSSGSKQEIHLECTREGTKTDGVVKIEAVSSDNIKGSMQMTVVNKEHTMTMNYSFTSRWLGSACTEEKP